MADPIAAAINQLLHPLFKSSAEARNVESLVDLLDYAFGKAAIIKPGAPPLNDVRTLSVSAGDQLPQRRKLPQVSNSKNAKNALNKCFAY